MYLALNKSLPLFFIFIGTMITLTSSSWFMAWVGLEVNMLAFIPIILTNNKMSNESALKYFFIQVSGSIMVFLFIIMTMNPSFMNSMDLANTLTKSIVPLALALKLGASPLHFWFPQLMEGLTWFSTSLLLTWQKIAPLFLMTTYNLLSPLMYIIIFTSAITGAIGGLNQLLLRKILAYSSINHLAWMLMSALISIPVLLTYFIIYTLITMTIIMMLMSNNFIHLTQLMCNHYSLYFIPVSLFMNFLSLGGMPPFLGFMPKWIVLTLMTMNNMFFASMLLVMCSILTLYFYMRISFNMLMMAPKMTWFNKAFISPTWLIKLMSMVPLLTMPLVIML